MREERRKEVSQKKNQTILSFQHQDVLQEVEEMCEEGESLDDLINDGFMIKCEGCDQILKTNTFFKHASHSQKCKAVYGERLEMMKKEKRRKIRQISHNKNKEKNKQIVKEYQSKNKESIGKRRAKKFLENSAKEKEIREDERISSGLNNRNITLDRTLKKLISKWKDCRCQDVKEFRKSDAMLKNNAISIEIANMNQKVNETAKQYETKLENTIEESRDRRKLNLDLQQIFEDWKMYAKKTDHSFKDIEKATGRNLTCYQCIIRNFNCYPKCESTIDEKDDRIQKLIPYELEIA